MQQMKLATWNINSVRLRLDLVTSFLKKEKPDVLCLQEIKVINEHFPAEAFKKLGYVHQAVHGQKGYHGVATLSRVPFRETSSHSFCENPDCRHIQVKLENGIELHNFYVPAGADIPDPVANPKFATSSLPARDGQPFRPTPRQGARPGHSGGRSQCRAARKRCLEPQAIAGCRQPHTRRDRAAHRCQGSVPTGIDVTREFVPHTEKIYSWWSYRAADWQASDRGRRLDHIWTSQALKGHVTHHAIPPRRAGLDPALRPCAGGGDYRRMRLPN